jgi:large subunit ribosomal protein L2
MALIKYKPRTPGTRAVVKVDRSHLYKGGPRLGLTAHQSKTGGRNHSGRITTRHHGGGTRQKYRLIDFKRDKDGITGIVERLEYDPNRTGHIALIKYPDGDWRYILAPKGMKAGDEVRSGADAPIKSGNAMSLRHIPVGSLIHNVEMKPGRGGQLARRLLGVLHCARGHLRLPAPQVRRDAQGAHRLPCHDRRGGER